MKTKVISLAALFTAFSASAHVSPDHSAANPIWHAVDGWLFVPLTAFAIACILARRPWK